MRNRSSTKQGNKKGGETTPMETDKLKKLKEEPQLSGAYIRSLVKQLTSSKTKGSSSPPPMTPKLSSSSSPDNNEVLHHLNHLPPQTLTNNTSTQQNSPTHLPQQPKKQVRRRLHTSKPYQERLLNMAEARREIVTALKYHRASMKQANEKQQQLGQPHEFPQNPSLGKQEEEERTTRCRRNPRNYPSNTNNHSNYLENCHPYSSFSCPLPPSNNIPFFCCSSSPPPIAPTLPLIDNLTLPNHQPLGLNLNFHDFNNLDTNFLYHQNNNTITTNNNNQLSSIYSYSSPSPSSTSPTLVFNGQEAHSFVTSREEQLMTAEMIDTYMMMNGGLHPTMDDENIAEIRSIGEQHEMEWNDRLNFVTSAWWFKFLKKMESSPNEKNMEENSQGSSPSLDQGDGFSYLFDEVMEFPTWMNTNNNESFFLQQHLDDSFSEDHLQEPTLPWMDIGEIDSMDSEWLA